MKCKICGKELSIYNRLGQCWCHGEVINEKGYVVDDTVESDESHIGTVCSSPKDWGQEMETGRNLGNMGMNRSKQLCLGCS